MPLVRPKHGPLVWLISGACLLGWSALPAAAAEEPAIDPFARQVLERMSDFAAGAESLAYDAVSETVEVPDDGLPERLRTETRVAMRRPDRLYVDISSDEVRRRVTLNGSRLLLHDLLADAYAVTEAPGGVEETLDLLEGTLGVFIPLGQLLRGDPLASIMDGVTLLSYGGIDDVGGIACHLVAARQSDLAWEAWVEDGPRPVLRKLVFHFSDDEGTTTYTALVEAWSQGSHLPDAAFLPPVPDGAREIPLREVPGDGK